MKQQKIKEKISIKKRLGVIFVIFLLCIGGIILYSRFIGTSGLIIKEHRIISNQLPKSFHGIKIVHVSDVHYGRTINERQLNHLVEEMNLTNPDIVVLTGDLIDKDITLTKEDQAILIKYLSQIDVSIDKYAITGNHDVNFDEWEQIITESGFINLNDTYDLIYKEGYEPILIAGISSSTYNKKGIEERMTTINEYLHNTDGQIATYRIFLLHEPDFISKINTDDYNLILAGHSHNGQIQLPLIGAIVLPDNAKEYYKEYYQLGQTHFFISSGIGTSTLNYRLFNRPSINVYRLNYKKES